MRAYGSSEIALEVLFNESIRDQTIDARRGIFPKFEERLVHFRSMLMSMRGAHDELFPSSFALLLAVCAPAPVTQVLRHKSIKMRALLPRITQRIAARGSTSSQRIKSTLCSSASQLPVAESRKCDTVHRLLRLHSPLMRTSAGNAPVVGRTGRHGSRARAAVRACRDASTTPGRPSACAGALGHIALPLPRA